MLNDEVVEKVNERLVNRIEQANEYILTEIGKKIKAIYNLSPKEAQQLIQVMKYGGDYEKIVKKLKEITKLNVKDIEKIFDEIAKNDYEFSKQFYDYRKKKFIPYYQNKELQRQIEALKVLTQKKYIDISRTSALGFTIRDNKGKAIFKGLRSVYNKAIDEAILNIVQGKSTYYDQMYKILKDIGISGLKTLDYESGRTLRLDSAIRMHMDDSIRQLHNEVQQQIGEEFDSDGVEITVHLNPAPDHERVQGKQFSNIEFNKFQNDKDSKSYDGEFFSHEHNGYDRRSISQYNCKHYTFSIILGVNIPQYSDEELKEIIDKNHKGFDFEGKHYTMYEGTQLQRQIETEIRKQKDLQIFAKTSGDDKLLYESQTKINQLNNKYNRLNQASGLLKKADRLRVSGYKRVKVVEKPILRDIDKQKNDILSMSIQNKEDKKQEKWLDYDNLPRWYQEGIENNVVKYDKEGKALVDYLNENGNANSDASKVFATKIRALGNGDINNRPTYIEYSNTKNGFTQELYGNTIKVPKLSDKENKTGSVSSTLHENWHAIDYLTNDSEFRSSSTYELKATIRNDNKQIGDSINELFKQYDTGCKEISTKIRGDKKYLYNELNEKFRSNEITYTTYRSRWTRTNNLIKQQIDYEQRNYMGGGYDKLEDIYDALSGGIARDTKSISYGHGKRYYKDIKPRAEEIFANYCTLSMIRPDLIELLKKDKPELCEELDKIIRSILDDK